MKIKILLLFLISVLFIETTNLKAAGIDKEFAAEIAENFFRIKSYFHLNRSADDFKIYESFTISSDGKVYYYVFNFSEGGFVIVSGDDSFYPVLGFSLENSYQEENHPEGLDDWLHWYELQMKNAEKSGYSGCEKIRQEWENLINSSIINSEVSGFVNPLLSCKWYQFDNYNEMCPADPEGYNGHAPVGCVATAMSQLMYYFRFPPHGNGSNSYTPPYNNGVYGELTADFENTFYRWDEILDKVLEPNSAVAELCFHCGVSVNMSYTSVSAGANTSDVQEALTQYFNYLPSAEYFDRSDYPANNQWMSMLIENLNNGQPMIYRSTGGWAGHAYVCDGYSDSTHFHFNWGWNGCFNGYYYIDELIPGGINLSYGQAAVMNIYPDTINFEYPVFCHDQKILQSNAGTFEDCSGPENYQPDSECTWLINPDNPDITNIYLEFSKFNTETEYDIVSIYDGNSAGAPLIGTYSGSSIPGSINSEGNSLFITFNTNGINENSGWQLFYFAYSLPFCEDFHLLTATDGSFEDGSKRLDYTSGTNCEWLIFPETPVYDSVDRIKINFHSFSLASGDTLFIYDGNGYNSPLLGKFTGYDLPSDIFSSTNKVLFNFVTDDTMISHGWEINYYSLPPVYCHDTTYLSGTDGSIKDGSGEKNYVDDSECYWIIEPPGAEVFTITFSKLDVEKNYDYVKIFDYSENHPVLIEKYTGNELPDSSLVINTRRIMVKFYSDYIYNYDGFELFYTSSAANIEKVQTTEDFKIYPNPAGDFLIVENASSSETKSVIEIYEISGRKIYSAECKNFPAIVNLSNFGKGVYLIKIISDKKIFNKKITCV